MYNASIPGWMPKSQLKILETIVSKVPTNGTIIEVGSFVGRSSWCIAKTAPTAKVYCLDIWNAELYPHAPPVSLDPNVILDDFGNAESIEQAKGSLENFKFFTKDCPNIIPVRGTSPTDFSAWDVKADLVFLDGIHSNPGFKADLEFWINHVKPGGIYCGDDCSRAHEDILWTIYDFCREKDLVFKVDGRIWTIFPRE